MADRRLLGMDLGITSHHVVAILDGNGQVLARRRCRPTADSLTTIDRSGHFPYLEEPDAFATVVTRWAHDHSLAG